eukprot:Gb_35842 [translate_table: standard]
MGKNLKEERNTRWQNSKVSKTGIAITLIAQLLVVLFPYDANPGSLTRKLWKVSSSKIFLAFQQNNHILSSSPHKRVSGGWFHLLFHVPVVPNWTVGCKAEGRGLYEQKSESESQATQSHSCIHDDILEQRRRLGRKEYSVTPQIYQDEFSSVEYHRKGRDLLAVSNLDAQVDKTQPIRIFLNYDAVGHSPDRDCRNAGDIVKLGEPPISSSPGMPVCNSHAEPPVYGDCWYNCTVEDISGEDKKQRLHEQLKVHLLKVQCSYLGPGSEEFVEGTGKARREQRFPVGPVCWTLHPSVKGNASLPYLKKPFSSLLALADNTGPVGKLV